MKKFILLLIFLIPLSSAFSQSNWQFTNPTPVGNNLYAVKFVDNNTVYTSGDGGVVLKSTDAGLSWVQFNTNNVLTYCGISSFGPLHLTLASFSKYTVLTTNGGINWNSYFSNNIFIVHNRNYPQLNTKCYTDANTIYSFIKGAYFYKSTDGGVNYSSMPTFYRPKEIYFVNSSTGWIYHDSSIYKTTNGGLNYSRQIIQKYSKIRNFSFLNENFGIMLPSENPLLLTTDGGENWIAKTIDNISNYIRVDYTDSNTIYLCRDSGLVVKSTNRGTDWITLNTNYNESLYDIDFKDKNTGIVVGATGCILRTNNGGLTWSQRRNGLRNDIESFYFIDQNTGFFVGDESFIAKTTNGGANLQTINVGSLGKFFGTYFLNEYIGYIVGEQGRILKTTDGGNNWTVKYSNPSIWLIDIVFIDESIGFAVGSKRTILKTTDGGDNWSIFYQGIFNEMQFLKVKFINELTGYVSGVYLYKTTDCGSNWSMVIPPNPSHLYYYNDIDFYNNTMFVIRYDYSFSSTTFMYSTNAGNNWVNKSISPYKFPRFIPFGIDFISDSVGYICGQGNEVIKTTNRGTNWIVEQGSVFPRFVDYTDRNHLKKIIVFDTSYILTAGQRGIILRKGSPLMVSTKNNTIICNSYSLHQNYPNPFNPTTKIKFDLPRSTHAKLIICDILGREVVALVNEKLGAGSYEVSWQASSYPSGVYFYKLVTNNFVDIKKMLLIK